jgi:hypothetical protein
LQGPPGPEGKPGISGLPGLPALPARNDFLVSPKEKLSNAITERAVIFF